VGRGREGSAQSHPQGFPDGSCQTRLLDFVLSLQLSKGEAKPCQIRQVRRLLEEYNLLREVDR
jgi:hypothetical protein